MKSYTNEQMFDEKIKIKEGWRKLNYTTHALERINQREKGSLICYPSRINISRNNVISCECAEGSKKPTLIKYQTRFKKGEMMILVISTKEKWKVITVYFKKIKYGKNKR